MRFRERRRKGKREREGKRDGEKDEGTRETIT